MNEREEACKAFARAGIAKVTITVPCPGCGSTLYVPVKAATSPRNEPGLKPLPFPEAGAVMPSPACSCHNPNVTQEALDQFVERAQELEE